MPLIKSPLAQIISDYTRLIRFNAPIGTWLLFWPCLWGMALAGVSIIDWRILIPYSILFFIGAFCMRSAGCIWNDIVDRDLDKKVARTQNRPIAAGRISRRQAASFMVLLALLGFGVLLQFNKVTILTGSASLILILIYPFMKRVTWWPQFFLGTTFNWGALLGWTAITGQLEWPALILWGGGIFWTLGYDTIYAGQDRNDDQKIGIKSSIIRLGEKTRLFLYRFYTGFMIMLGLAIVVAPAQSKLSLLFLPLLLIASYLIVYYCHLDDEASCLASFKKNNRLGLTVFLVLAIPAF